MSAFNIISEPASRFWDGRSARDRKVISLLILLMAAAFIFLVLFMPAIEGRKNLNKSLPVARTNLAHLQQLVRELAEISGNAAQPAVPMTKEGLDAALARSGLKSQYTAVTGEFIKVQFSTVSFAGVIAWLADMQKTARLSVAEANVVALAQPDTVNVTLTLRQPQNQ